MSNLHVGLLWYKKPSITDELASILGPAIKRYIARLNNRPDIVLVSDKQYKEKCIVEGLLVTPSDKFSPGSYFLTSTEDFKYCHTCGCMLRVDERAMYEKFGLYWMNREPYEWLYHCPICNGNE